MSDINQIIKLIEYWKAFRAQGAAGNLEAFGQWLAQQEAQNKTFDVPNEYFQSPNLAVGFLLGNVMAYAEVWTKLAFRDLPLQGFHDFGMLKFVEDKTNPTKKEVAADSILEDSTTFEAIKRLGKQGLLAEAPDPKDRRVRRVTITEAGKQVVQQAMQQAVAMSDLLVGNLDAQEKEALINMLQKLAQFHDHMYRNTTKEHVITQYKM